jgi:hypothetical protein
MEVLSALKMILSLENSLERGCFLITYVLRLSFPRGLKLLLEAESTLAVVSSEVSAEHRQK